MKKVILGKLLIATSVMMAFTPSVILADDGVSTTLPTTSTTPMPPAKPTTTNPNSDADNAKHKAQQKQQQQRQNQNQNTPNQPDYYRQQTQMQDIPDPVDLNSD